MFILRFLNKAVSCSEPLVAQLIEPGRVRVRRSRVFGYRPCRETAAHLRLCRGARPSAAAGNPSNGDGGERKTKLNKCLKKKKKIADEIPGQVHRVVTRRNGSAQLGACEPQQDASTDSRTRGYLEAVLLLNALYCKNTIKIL